MNGNYVFLQKNPVLYFEVFCFFLEFLNREGKKIALSDFHATKSAFPITIIFIGTLLCSVEFTQNLTVLGAVKNNYGILVFPLKPLF